MDEASRGVFFGIVAADSVHCNHGKVMVMGEEIRDVSHETSVPSDMSGVSETAPVESPAGPVTDGLDGSPLLGEVLGDALGKLERFHGKLMAEGEPRGLIGPRDVPIVWERHILNSAAVVPFIREATAGERFKTVADVGSGGAKSSDL